MRFFCTIMLDNFQKFIFWEIFEAQNFWVFLHHSLALQILRHIPVHLCDPQLDSTRSDPARHDTLGRSVNSLAKSNLMQLIGETFWLISHCDLSWDEVSWTSTHEISIRWLHSGYITVTQWFVLIENFLMVIWMVTLLFDLTWSNLAWHDTLGRNVNSLENLF